MHHHLWVWVRKRERERAGKGLIETYTIFLFLFQLGRIRPCLPWLITWQPWSDASYMSLSTVPIDGKFLLETFFGTNHSKMTLLSVTDPSNCTRKTNWSISAYACPSYSWQAIFRANATSWWSEFKTCWVIDFNIASFRDTIKSFLWTNFWVILHNYSGFD